GANAKVVQRTLRLRAPESVGRNGERSEGVAFASCFAFRLARSGHHFLRKRSRRTTSPPPTGLSGAGSGAATTDGFSGAAMAGGRDDDTVRGFLPAVLSCLSCVSVGSGWASA